jgi:type I restriction enzyme S subunit
MMGNLPSDWQICRVGELCTVLNGLAFKPEYWGSQGLPIIRIQNLNGSSEFNYYDGWIADPYIVPYGTLLFSWSGNRGTSFGPFIWTGSNGILNQHIFRVEPKPDIQPRWLYYALDVVRRLAEQSAHGGSGLVHVRRGDFLGYELPTPGSFEQRRIAEILGTLDEALRKTEQLIAKLKQIKQGLLDDLLTRGIDDNGDLRDPARHPEQFKESPLGRLPRDWEIGPLEGWLAGPPKNGYSPEAAPEWTGWLMLGLGCLTLSGFCPVQLKNAPRNDKGLERAVLRNGDLLMSRANTRDLVGLVGRFEDVGSPCTYPDLMMRLAPKAERTTAAFMELVLSSTAVRRQMQAAAVGTSESMVKISGAIVRRLLVGFPPLPGQRRVLEMYGAANSRIATEEVCAEKLRLLKQGLMEDLLTGRVRVTSLSDQAAA